LLSFFTCQKQQQESNDGSEVLTLCKEINRSSMAKLLVRLTRKVWVWDPSKTPVFYWASNFTITAKTYIITTKWHFCQISSLLEHGGWSRCWKTDSCVFWYVVINGECGWFVSHITWMHNNVN